MSTDSRLYENNLAISAHQLRAEVTFKKLRELMIEKGIEVLLLKGPHLAHTIYNVPKERIYGDLDILVKPGDFKKAADVLLENDFIPLVFNRFTPSIQNDFKHWEYLSIWGIVVEMHRWLSGHDRYPIDCSGLFERAEQFVFGETPAMGLGTEDLLLHLCLHMGSSLFFVIEPKHVLDIALLTRKRQVNWDIFMKRCKQFHLLTITYFALLAAKGQQRAEIPEMILCKLRPGRFRLCWLGRYLQPESFPIYRFPEQRLTQIKTRLVLPLIDRISDWPRYLLRLGRVYGKSLWQKIKIGNKTWY